MIRRTLTVIAAALAFGAVALSAAQAAPADIAACRDGSYVQYIDPTDGTRFNNQGACISYVNGGGALEVAVGKISLSIDRFPSGAPYPDSQAVIVHLSGFLENDFVTLHADYSDVGGIGGYYGFGTTDVPTDWTGSATRILYLRPEGFMTVHAGFDPALGNSVSGVQESIQYQP
jgi:hypothetical protein